MLFIFVLDVKVDVQIHNTMTQRNINKFTGYVSYVNGEIIDINEFYIINDFKLILYFNNIKIMFIIRILKFIFTFVLFR